MTTQGPARHLSSPFFVRPPFQTFSTRFHLPLSLSGMVAKEFETEAVYHDIDEAFFWTVLVGRSIIPALG